MSIASNLKAQLVGQLIAALGNGAQQAGQNGQNATAGLEVVLGELQTGQTIIATVAGAPLNGKLPLVLNGAPLLADVRGANLPPEALRTGAALRLTVEEVGATPKLAFQALAPTKLSPSVPNPQIPAKDVQITTPLRETISQLASPPTLPQIIAKATIEAASKQGSAAPLYADLAVIVAKSDNGLPAPIQRIAAALLSNRIDGDQTIIAKDVRQAFKETGIFKPDLVPKSETQPLDIKSLLVALRQALQSENSEQQPRNFADQNPPRRDAPVTAHKSVVASLRDETDNQKILSTLARESDQAIERIKLHQIASLPERLVAPEATSTRQFNFEIPIALGQQTAMAGFRIEREKKRNTKPGEPTDVWGIRFAIDADILGPVHAHLRLAGPKISVSLWAEDPATHRFFVQSMPLLEAALAENALEIGELVAFPGKPAEARPASTGHFLDKRS